MNMEKLYDTYYNKVDNLILNGRESSYMYMGVLEHHIPEIGLKRKDEERPNYYVTDTYFNRHLDEYKQSKEICAECEFSKGCTEKRKDPLKREDCPKSLFIESQIVQYLFYYSEKLHSVIVYERWGVFHKDDLGALTVAELQGYFAYSMLDEYKIMRKDLDYSEQKKIYKDFKEEVKKENRLIIVTDYASKWIPEYTNFVSKNITGIEITNIFDILKLI